MQIHEIQAAAQVGFPALSLLIFLPLLCAVFVFFIDDAKIARKAAFLGSLLELGLSIGLMLSFLRQTPSIQFAEQRPWIPTLGITYHLGIDGLSVLFLPITALLTTLILAASWHTIQTRVPAFCAAILMLEAMVMGIFSSLDLILFFVFWEASLVPIYFLVNLWGVGPERRYAAMKFVLTMLVASGPLLLGIVLLGISNRHHGTGAYCFDWVTLRSQAIAPDTAMIVFFLMLAGFAVKGPFVPLHAWMPAMLRESPVGIGVVLTGLKLGAYGVLRFVLPILPEMAAQYGWLLGALGVIGIVYGALIALVQPNLRRLLSFACLSHVGYVLLGMSSGSEQGIAGATLSMLNLGLSATGLFFLTGFLQERVGSSDLSALGGVAKKAPRAAALFLLLGLASIGLPATSGFVGEHLVLLSAYRMSLPLFLLALFGTVLGAAAILSVFEKVFLGPVTQPRVASMKDLRPEQWGLVATLALLSLFVGVYPRLALELVSPSAEALAKSQTEIAGNQAALRPVSQP